MKHLRPALAALLLLASLHVVPAADAQLPWRWFGPKAADKTPPAKADARRAIEVSVEVAWLADPVTFPYYLEAHADETSFEVRGYVPNKTVRAHALRIAQVYSSLAVTDAMKEHASLLVRPSQMSPQQLQNSAVSSLRSALPKQYQQLKVECGADGKVYVAGTVKTIEERVAVSQSLRRLHGCTSVQNLTTLPGEVVATAADRLPIIKASNTSEIKGDKPAADTKSKSWFGWPFANATTTDEPPLLEPSKPSDAKGPVLADAKNARLGAPILIPSVADKKDREPIDTPVAPAKALSVAELKKCVRSACPKVLSVEVEFTSATEARVTLEIRTDEELAPTAEKVFALPELQNYRLDLQFKISAP